VDWPRTPFVGREDDLAVLRSAYGRMVREPSVQLVTITGEPGVGKSRLVAEFQAFVDDRPELVSWRQGRSLPYGEGVAFWSLAEIVKSHVGILESDDPDAAAAKVRRLVDEVAEERDRSWLSGRLAALVGAAGGSGATHRDESFTAWSTFLEAVAATRPLVLVFEDVHWADDALLEFIEHLADLDTAVPMLIVCAARPELHERRPRWAGGKRNATTIALTPLSGEETARLIGALLDQAVLPAETQSLLLERAGGNPLYAEEFVRMLVDRGALTRRGGTWGLVEPGGIAVPDSVHALIAARLDTLPADRKVLLQNASVIGKVFWDGAVAAMSDVVRDQAREGLQDLVRRELVRRARRSSVDGEAEFAFSHLLIRDVAYGQIPRAARAGKHRAAAAWIEGLAGGSLAPHAELLAHHYSRALELSRAAGDTAAVADVEPEAIRFLILAGDRARELDVAQALPHYEQALALLRADDPARATVLFRMGRAANSLGKFDQAIEWYKEARSLFREQGDPVRAGECTAELSHTVWTRGDTTWGWELAREAIGILEREAPGPELALAYHRMAGAHMMAGIPEPAQEWARKGIALSKSLGLPLLAARSRSALGVVRCQVGDMGGLDDLREAVRQSVEAEAGGYAASAYNNLGDWLWFLEGPRRGLEAYRAGVEFAGRRGFLANATWARAQTLWTLFDLGEWDELLREADIVLGWDRERGGSQVGVIAGTYRAHVLVRRGEIAESVALMEEFLPRAREVADAQVLFPALVAAALTESAQAPPTAARDLIEEFERVTRKTPDYRSLHVVDGVRVAVGTGDTELAARLLEGGSEPAARHRHAVLTARATLAEANGQAPEALELYEDAARRWAEFGFVLERGQALLGTGRCLVRLGRATEARTPLEDARAVFLGLRAKPLVAQVDAVLERATALTS